MKYALREGICFCDAGDRPVLLDIHAGRYFAVAVDTCGAFRRWSVGAAAVEGDLDRLQTLVRQGVLIPVDDATQPIVASPVRLGTPAIGLKPTSGRPQIWGCAIAIVSRLIWARRIRRSHFSQLIDALRSAKVRSFVQRRVEYPMVVSQIAKTFTVSDYVLGRHDLCLERSIAFAATCWRRKIPASLVIGVQTNPFAAHSWVQDGNLVLNETPERAQMFTPILVV